MNPYFKRIPNSKETQVMNNPQILKDHQISNETQIIDKPQILKESQITNEPRNLKHRQI